MGKLFGTDGVRGVANVELTPELAYNLGKAAAFMIKKNVSKPTFVIGKDTRVSGDMLENAIASGIMAAGGNVLKIGVMPTPAVAYLVKHYGGDAGVVISASHNPYEYNGIKFFNGKGFKLDDDIEDEIERIIEEGYDQFPQIVNEELGTCRETKDDAISLYDDYLVGTAGFDLKGKKIVLDCANGAAYKTAENVYKALGAEVVIIGNDPDGVNINKGCGSTHTELLQEKVVSEGAFMGMAFDGDADRLIAIDELGRVIDGDKVICICAEMLKGEGLLHDNKVTATVMSNLGFHKHLEKMDCVVEVTKVGDRYVLESMLETGSVIGGEQSGHIIFLNHSTTGDGVLSSIQLLKAILKRGENPSKISDGIVIYPQVLRNTAVKNENKKKILENKEIKEAITRVEEELVGKGRVLIRPSGTEPVVRVMLEGEDTQVIGKMADELAEMITKKFG